MYIHFSHAARRRQDQLCPAAQQDEYITFHPTPPLCPVFLLTYFFMRNAERVYNHPASLGEGGWVGVGVSGVG